MQQEQATSSRSSSSGLQMEIKEGMESDDEIRRVPDFAAGAGEPAGPSASGGRAGLLATSTSQVGQRKRGKGPADKEHKRLKRLLRNRVSAQQARERKKAYLRDLEAKVKELERKNLELEERLSTLQNENQMLRQDHRHGDQGFEPRRWWLGRWAEDREFISAAMNSISATMNWIVTTMIFRVPCERKCGAIASEMRQWNF